MNIWGFCVHWNQQVILSLLFNQASHEGRIYSLLKLQKSQLEFTSDRKDSQILRTMHE